MIEGEKNHSSWAALLWTVAKVVSAVTPFLRILFVFFKSISESQEGTEITVELAHQWDAWLANPSHQAKVEASARSPGGVSNPKCETHWSALV